ncbi:hypothetical protein D3C71_1309530 [compost metagenome]
MLRQILNGRLEQRELVRNERIAVNEVIPILIIPVGLRAVGKVEQGLEVVGLRVVSVRQKADAFFGFHEQTLLNNLRHVGAGQLHAIGEPGLDFREVVALLFAHLADNRPHVLLGGHDDPCAAAAFGCHALGDGLEVGHQLDVFSDVLTDLIDKEVQAEIGRLPLDICMHLFGKIFDGDTVLAAVFIEYPHGRCLVTTGCLGIGFGNVFRFKQGLLAALLPCSARCGFIGRLELFIEATTVEVALKLGDVPLFAVVPAHLVKDLDEDSEERIELSLADDVRFLVNVEQNAFRRDGDRSFEIAAQDFIVATLGQEQVKSRGPVDLPVFEQERQHLQQVGFA